MKIDVKAFVPHVIALLVFVVFSAGYFHPVIFDGKQLKQSDVKQYQGAAKEITDYRTVNGEEALWTNGMFSGMPAYQISVIHKGNLMNQVATVLRLGLTAPVGVMFVTMLGFYILGMCLRINPWIAAVGAIAFGFASFNILYLGAGHITKVNAVSFMAPTLGGLLLATRGKWLWGSVVFAFFLSLNISANHLQITYYLFILLGVIALGEGIRLIIEKKYIDLAKIVGALLVATGLAILPSASNLMTTYEYSKYSTRGDSDISVAPKGTDKATKAKSGLDKSYILEYNFGPREALSLFIPNAKGGAGGYIGNNESAMESIEDPTYYDQIAQSNQYWGGQLFSGGAIYLGAVAFFLFLVGLFLVKDTLRFPIIALSILCVLLASKTGGLNFWFIDHFPMYNKFRDSKMILVILQLLVPMVAVMLLDRLWKSEELQGTRKFQFGVLGGVLALGLLLYAVPSISGDFITGEEIKQFNEYAKQSKDPSQLTMIEGLKAELINVRQSIYKADAGRTLLFFIGAGVAVLLAFYKVNRWVWLGLIGVFIATDEINVDLRYLNADPVEEMSEELAKYEDRSAAQIPYMPEKADVSILNNEAKLLPSFKKETARIRSVFDREGLYADQPTEIIELMAGFTALQLNSNYRVFTFDNPFNETVTSYFHKSIGGYHGAKVKRYQQLVDFYLQDEMQKANGVISSIKMAKLQNYARTMEIPQDKAKEIFDTISVAGGQMSDTCQILNMLNTKYVVLTRTDEPMLNPYANGNVWYVNKVTKVNSANEELLGLGKINTKNQAIVDVSNAGINVAATYATDSADVIAMTKYATKEITYQSNSSHKGFAVFSEIYYPEGWVCTIDGKEVPYTRVNYVLRGLEIPAGKHQIVWKFQPSSFIAGTSYSMVGSLILILAFLGVGGLQLKKKEEDKEA
jgi:hypothetical protein